MIILRQKNYSEPIYYQDGIMIRYNGNKIDDVKEVLTNSSLLKSLDKAISENTKNVFNENKEFLKRRGINLSNKLKIKEIDIWGDPEKKPYSISFDCYYDKVPGLFTSEYDIWGKYLRSSYND
jgi:hypothetical protein